jgi:sec-independent protein translocase protein TatA
MTTMPLIFNLNSWEVLVVVFLILLLFGGKKIPELAKGLGKGIREFNNARSSIETEIKDGMREAERKPIEEKKEQI